MSTKPYKLSVFIFRRDLRLQDNSGLIAALQASEKVIPCFIGDPRQLKNNPYRSAPGIQFMSASLQDLQQQLTAAKGKLYYFSGLPEEIIQRLKSELKIEAVYVNRDYTPFSRKRDQAIEKICQQVKIDFCSFSDLLLQEPEDVLNQQGEAYRVFTHYYKKAQCLPVGKPVLNKSQNYFSEPIAFAQPDLPATLLTTPNPLLLLKGGRQEGLTLLKKISALANYAQIRDFPALKGTTLLSGHLKFGTISVREFHEQVVDQFGKNHDLLKELHWRDFFTSIAFYYPQVLGQPFNQHYQTLPWENNKHYFQRWCEGKTGFPIVDAGMRQLNETGYMHNRVRMITASFLVKDLHIDWRWGERYFAQKLLDYDPAVNNGNWQWVASTGCDAQPFFRIFNPWLQQKKFDPQCEYIKQWVPELAAVAPSLIHQLYQRSDRLSGYPTAMIDHKKESEKAKKMYESG